MLNNTNFKDSCACSFSCGLSPGILYLGYVPQTHVVFVHLTDLELKSRPSVDSVSSTPQKFEKSEHS